MFVSVYMKGSVLAPFLRGRRDLAFPRPPVSPLKKHYGSQDPRKSVAGEDRSGQPDELSSKDYSKFNYDRAWSTQEWRAEGTTHDRSGQPDKASWRMLQHVRPHHGETLLDGTS